MKSLAIPHRRLVARALLMPLAIAAAFAFTPSLAGAQALPGLSSLRVTYNTRKATASPQGELKAQLDAVDKELTAAMRAGNAGEARRQLARGLALLAGTAWTPALDYQSSLVIRSDRTVADSAVPYGARLEQIYRPAIDLTAAMTARVSLMKRQPSPPGAAGAAAAAARGPATMVTVRDFGRMDGIARDLRESPFPMELDLAAEVPGRIGDRPGEAEEPAHQRLTRGWPRAPRRRRGHTPASAPPRPGAGAAPPA